MFLHCDIKGADLPPKTLCLTYDDGPGDHTAELARYLQGERIEATFFVIGHHAHQRPEVLDELCRCRHTIGNHTNTHPGLVSVAESGGDVVAELTAADEIIRPYLNNQPAFFRAPYGNWRQVDPETGSDRAHSIVAELLNASGRVKHYIGPVNWDISAEDFAFWRRGESAQAACDAYLHEIETVERGIVLLHDSSDEELIRRNNLTLDLTRLLVPELRRRGYAFVPLRDVPQIRRLYCHQPKERNDAAGMCTNGSLSGPAG